MKQYFGNSDLFDSAHPKKNVSPIRDKYKVLSQRISEGVNQTMEHDRMSRIEEIDKRTSTVDERISSA